MNIDNILVSKKSVFIILLCTFLILLIPLAAMNFTDEVDWSVGDFVLASFLLSFFGYLYKVLTNASKNTVQNIIIGFLIFGLFIFVWVNLI